MVITFLCNLSKTERAISSVQTQWEMLGFVIAQVFAVFRGTFIRCIRRGRRDSGTVPVLLLEVFEKGSCSYCMSPSSNPSHSTSALPRCTIPKLLCSGLCRWVLLCGFREIKRKRRPAQAGCLCPLICKKQTPTKQVPVLIATPKGANWGQENELSFKTVVTAKTLRDKVSQERKKKKPI